MRPIEEMQKEINTRKAELNRAEGELARIEKELEGLGVTPDTMDAEIERLGKEIVTYDENINGMATRIEGLLDGTVQPSSEAEPPALATVQAEQRNTRARR